MEGSFNVDNIDKSLIFSVSFTTKGSLLSDIARKFVSPNIHSKVFAINLVHRKGWGTCLFQKAIITA